jgi:hypothetical protein
MLGLIFVYLSIGMIFYFAFRSWEEDGLTMLDINKLKRSHRILFRLSIIFLWIIYMIIFIAFIILGTCSWFVKEIVGIFK